MTRNATAQRKMSFEPAEPPAGLEEARWTDWTRLLSEFWDSGAAAAKVKDYPTTAERAHANLSAARRKLGRVRDIRVKLWEGDVWLIRNGNAEAEATIQQAQQEDAA